MVGNRMKTESARNWMAVLVLVSMGLSACTMGSTPQIHITGKVFGEAPDLGVTTPRPVKARVTCNGASVLAEADGTFTLAVPQAKQYRCSASASPVYNEQSATFSDALGTAIELNFVSRGQAACAVFPSAADVECSI